VRACCGRLVVLVPLVAPEEQPGQRERGGDGSQLSE
jgi:hypothetical protein